MAEMDTSSGGGHKKGPGVKKPKKLSTRVDLTPMVDLGFLLITFFVFTTTMSKTTAMKMNVPKDSKDEDQRKIKESGVMTILLGKADQVYYYNGILTAENATEIFKKSSFKDIRQQILDKKKAVPDGDKPVSDLVYIIKGDKESKFKNAIDIFDEMQISKIPSGHYAEGPLNEVEALLIKKTEEVNGIK
jgi:biopolymer transport protein ExbD